MMMHQISRLRFSELNFAAVTLAASVSIQLSLASSALGKDRSTLICDSESRICYRTMSVERDSDGDGVSDIAEEAAGTDPANPDSRPSVNDLVLAIARQKDQVFLDGKSFILVLPTKDPSGKEIIAGSVGLFEGVQSRLGWPKRKSQLDGLGIDVGQIQKMGLDPNNGITISAGTLSGGNLKEIKTGSGRPLALGPTRTALVSAGEVGGGFKVAGQTSQFATTDAKGGVVTTKMEDINGGFKIHSESYGSDGKLLATQDSTFTKVKAEDGGTTHTYSTSTSTENGKTEKATETTKDAKGNVIHKRETEVKTNKDGQTTKNQETTQTVKGDEVLTETSCKGTECPKPKGYVNPDAEVHTVTVTSETVERIVRLRFGSNTTQGPDDSGPVISDADLDRIIHENGAGPIILTDREGGVLVVLSNPDDWCVRRSECGTKNTGDPSTVGADNGVGGQDPYANEGHSYLELMQMIAQQMHR
jgi:Bacterial TSP3 repeat